jgi:hypothetical protein
MLVLLFYPIAFLKIGGICLELFLICFCSKISGTTCATVLTKAIFTEGCKSVAAGMNAMDLRRGISMAVDDVVTNLKGMAKMISTSEEIAQVTLEMINCKVLTLSFVSGALFMTNFDF